MSNNSIKNLCKAISIPTVSAENTKPEMARFDDFHEFLKTTYPAFHKTVTLEVVNGLSLMYKWQGTSSEKKPIGLLAHQDVVGIEEGTMGDWTHPPFEGYSDEEYIWGRGASDTKCSLIAILEVCEELMNEGFVPDRDVYICFGNNEESVTGTPESGAYSMAEVFKERGIRLEFVIDEGGAVITDPFMGLPKPIATIGLAEKGYCDLKITVKGPGGHSSEPPPEIAVTLLSQLLVNLKEITAKQVKATNTLYKTLETIGENKSGILRFLLKHAKIFFPLIKGQLLADDTTAAMIRTTMTPTMLSAGTQPNVLPQKAEATINARLLPGDSKETLENNIREAAGGKIDYELEYISYGPPLPETSSNSHTYKLISELTEKIHGSIPFPYTVLGGTDSREYVDVADEIYRFYPFALTFDELGAMHNTNERLKCQSYLDGIKFYKDFIMGCCS